MKEIVVRRATEQDVEAITRLWREMADLHQEIEPMVWTTVEGADETARNHFKHLIGAGDHLVLVAVSENEVIGYLIAFKASRPPVLTPLVVGGIGDCCVTRAFRRKGVGRLLVAEAMKWFQARGFTQAEVSFALGNVMAASFWKKEGFRPYRATAVSAVEPIRRAD